MYNMPNKGPLKLGCMKYLKKEAKSKNKTHLINIFILIYFFSKILEKENLNIISPNMHPLASTNININYLYKVSLSLSVKKIKITKNKNLCTSICLLLIILSNDINPNPGPKPQVQNINIKCNTCAEEIIDEHQDLKCETCKNHYHICCLKINNEQIIQNESFQWICSRRKCPPNYQKSHFFANLISLNRYDSLNQESVNPQIHDDPITSIPTINITSHELENIMHLQELPLISPNDYEGKCACRICHKEVKDHHRAISCDKCEMWSHLKCCDISIKLYNHLKYMHYFKWTCTKCRINEQAVLETIDINDLDLDGQPDDISLVNPSRNELLILNLNCRSIINKREELEYIVNATKADLIVLTETWMDDSVPKHAYVPEGYKIIRKDRCVGYKQKYGRNKGGGIAILYKEHIKIEKKEYLTEEIDEIMWVHVKIKQSFMLGIVYRAEYTDVLDETLSETTIEKNIRKASEISNKLIVTGDFNIDMCNKENKQTKQLKTIYKAYGMSQQIKKPTRIDQTSKKSTIIDHFWVNESEIGNVKSSGTFIGLSDHLGTYLKLNKGRQLIENRKIQCRNYKNYDKEIFNDKLKETLADSNIMQHISNKNVNSATEELLSTIQKTVSLFAPMIEIQLKNKSKVIPWFTEELKSLIKIKNNLLTDSFVYGYEMFKSRIKQLSNTINHLKRKLKKEYLQENLMLYQNDPKKSWQIINTITDRKQINEKTEPDMMDQKKANDFNHYFANVGKEIQKNLQLNIKLDNFKGLPGFNFQPETIQSIKKLINSLKINTSTGHDNISVKILQDSADTTAPYICDIINLSYQVREFPQCMKLATITALHKKKDVNIMSNYRPISILPSLSKVLEKSATLQLLSFLEENQILSRHQHAYRKMHSTVTCLSQLVDYIYELVDQKKHTAIISLDLSKAFDSISHNLLLNKLAKQGLSETSILWIKSYLSNRQQTTKFKNYTSTEQSVTAGVPQGSIIGPLLFLCFTNDLYQIFEDCKIVSYADDTQILVYSNQPNKLITTIRQTILKAQSWYAQNSMQNNIEKTELLIINPKNNLNKTKFTLKENGKKITIKPASNIKVLGIKIDENLNWTTQTNAVKKNALNSIRHLHRINHLLPMKLRIQLYNSLVTPHFDYADIIWGGCGSVNSKKLQITQNFAVRSITGSKKRDSASASFQKLKFLNLQQRRNVHEAVFTNKSLLHLNPIDISLKYINQCSSGINKTRNCDKGTLNLPNHQTFRYQNSPFYRCISSWNACPQKLPTHNPKTFKQSLQRNMIEKTFNR